MAMRRASVQTLRIACAMTALRNAASSTFLVAIWNDVQNAEDN